MKKRILCILLVLCMVMAVMPFESITAIAKTDDEVQLSGDGSELTQPIVTEDVKQSAEEFYISYSAKNIDWVSTSCKVINTALTALPVTGQYAKIGVWAGKQFLNMMTGSSDNDKSEEILEAINQLNNQNQATLLKIDQLTDIVKEQDKLKYINECYSGDNALFELTKIYMGALQNTDGKTAAEIEESRRQILTYDIPEKSSSDVNSLSSLSSYDQTVLSWGEKLKTPIILNDGSCNPTDLMNNYALGHFKWEHHGYEMRENYWSSIINLYVTSSNLMRASLNARIEVYEDANGEGTAETLRQALQKLDNLNKDIQKLGKASGVNRLADNIRYYQVKGHDVYLFAQTTKQFLPYENAGYRRDFICEDDKKTNDYWLPFYTYTNSDTGKVYQGLDSKYYKYIYDDYNPAGSSKIINLYDIFFSKEEGNMTPPEGIDYSQPITFVSNDIYTDYWNDKSWRGLYEYWTIYCKIYEAYGKISDKYTLIANFEDAYTQYHHYIDKEYVEGFIMVIPAVTPNNEVNVGQGEIVTEKDAPFTVTFDANGGSVDIKSIKTDMNGYIAELPTPSYAGYEFDGWYTDQDVKVTLDTQFTENTTVYAKWISINSSTNDTNPTKYNAPKTGDSRPIVPWLALFFVSSGILIGANAYRKRKNND